MPKWSSAKWELRCVNAAGPRSPSAARMAAEPTRAIIQPMTRVGDCRDGLDIEDANHELFGAAWRRTLVDSAFAWLDRAIDERELPLVAMQFDPAFDEVRDPRTTTVIARLTASAGSATSLPWSCAKKSASLRPQVGFGCEGGARNARKVDDP